MKVGRTDKLKSLLDAWEPHTVATSPHLKALGLTAQDLQKLGVIDRIIKEPLGGAQRGRKETIEAVGKALETMLKELSGKKPEWLVKDRRQKFLDMGSKGLAA